MIRRVAIAGAAMLLCAGAAAHGQGLATLDGERLTQQGIAADVQRLMAADDVKGLGVALIRDGKVVYLRAFGQRDVVAGLPLQPDTVMYGASLTKATFAYMIMQLVDERRLDLDRPVAAYLPKPLTEYPEYADLAADPRWRRLTMRMLLDHTAGFANFRFLEPDGKLRFQSDPGTRYAYSGEGILLAQRVLEWGLGLDVGAEMQRRVFDRYGMTRTSMTWRNDFAGNLAQGYTLDGKLQPHDQRSKVRAPGSMDTTLADWAAFLAAVSRGEGLTSRSFDEMTRRQIAIGTDVQFPTLAARPTKENDPIRLGYGLGWGVFDSPFGTAFFK